MVSSIEEIPIPHHGIAVILLKNVFGEIPMPSIWYCCDPPQRYLQRDPITIIMVLLWSSSKTSLEISQCHHYGIPVIFLNDFLVKRQDWFVSNPASWQRNPRGRSQQYHKDIIGISLKDIFEEDHSNTMLMALGSLRRCLWGGSQQYHCMALGSLHLASGISSSGQLHFSWVDGILDLVIRTATLQLSGSNICK